MATSVISSTSNSDLFRMNNTNNSRTELSTSNHSNHDDWISTAHIPIDLSHPTSTSTSNSLFKRPQLDPNRRKSTQDRLSVEKSTKSSSLDQTRREHPEQHEAEAGEEEEMEELDDEDDSDSESEDDASSSPRDDEPASSPFNLDSLDLYALAGFGLNSTNKSNHRTSNRSDTSNFISKSRPGHSNTNSNNASDTPNALATTPVNGIGMVPSPSASTPGNAVMTPNTTKDYVGSAIQLLTHFLGSSNPNSSASDDNQSQGGSNANTPRGQNGQGGTQNLLVSRNTSKRLMDEGLQ